MAASMIGDKWFLSGGAHEDEEDTFAHVVRSTLTFDGSNFEPSRVLPYYKSGHCQATINSTHIFFAAGGNETFILDFETQEYSYYENIPRNIGGETCGLLNNGKNGPEVLVAQSRFSYIFSLSDKKWRDGPTVPELQVGMASAPSKNGLVIFGGAIPDKGYIHSVYEFDEKSYQWISKNVQTRYEKSDAIAVGVPNDFITCI